MVNHPFVGSINNAIKENARTTVEWEHRELADFAYSVFEAVNAQLYHGMLPDCAIGFDKRLKKAGEYYFESDSMGLKHHFDMRPDLTKVEVIIAVLHNAVHAWQDAEKPKGQWYHTNSFGKEISNWGITVDKNGDAVELDINVFSDTLDKIGMTTYRTDVMDYEAVEATDFSLNPNLQAETITKVKAPTTKSKTVNKMKKWSCACSPPTNVRCATNLQAHCDVCLADFELKD